MPYCIFKTLHIFETFCANFFRLDPDFRRNRTKKIIIKYIKSVFIFQFLFARSLTSKKWSIENPLIVAILFKMSWRFREKKQFFQKQEFMVAIDVTSSGTPREKLMWAFRSVQKIIFQIKVTRLSVPRPAPIEKTGSKTSSKKILENIKDLKK